MPQRTVISRDMIGPPLGRYIRYWYTYRTAVAVLMAVVISILMFGLYTQQVTCDPSHGKSRRGGPGAASRILVLGPDRAVPASLPECRTGLDRRRHRLGRRGSAHPDVRAAAVQPRGNLFPLQPQPDGLPGLPASAAGR